MTFQIQVQAEQRAAEVVACLLQVAVKEQWSLCAPWCLHHFFIGFVYMPCPCTPTSECGIQMCCDAHGYSSRIGFD